MIDEGVYTADITPHAVIHLSLPRYLSEVESIILAMNPHTAFAPKALRSHHLFVIPELLEWILSFLPTRQLLAYLGVNKFWRQMIESSPKLQQKLYKRPIMILADVPSLVGWYADVGTGIFGVRYTNMDPPSWLRRRPTTSVLLGHRQRIPMPGHLHGPPVPEEVSIWELKINPFLCYVFPTGCHGFEIRRLGNGKMPHVDHFPLPLRVHLRSRSTW